MKELMKKFASEESGQGLVEYALIIVLIAVAAIAGLQAVKGAIGGEDGTGGVFGQIVDGLGGGTGEGD